MNCEIDYCTDAGTQTLKVETEGEEINIRLCKPHAKALQARVSERLGALGVINLYADKLPGTMGDVQDALAYLDGRAAAGNA